MEKVVNHIMRVRAHMSVMLLVCLILMFAGCRTSSNRTPAEDYFKMAYDLTSAAEVTYNSSREILKTMDDRGQLTEEQKATIVGIASKLYTSVHISKTALVAYKTALDAGQEEGITKAEVALRSAVSAMQVVERDLVTNIMVADNGSK